MTNASLAAAAARAEAAIERGNGDAHDFVVAALGRAERGDAAQAEALFERALALEPGNPATLTGLAIFRRGQGRLRDAILACDAAIRAVPDYPDAWLERGAILAGGGSNVAARESFARAVRLNPGLAAAHAGLAALAARDGAAQAAHEHAGRALAIDPGNAVAINAMASAELAQRNPEQARRRLEAMLGGMTQASPERSFALSLLGDAAARLGDHAAAYRHYLASKADFAALNASAATGLPTHREFVEAIIAGLQAIDLAAWQRRPALPPAGSAPRHVFLIGYPRSGTTLLENVLASLPGVAAIEERPTLSAADRAYLTGDHAAVVRGLDAFARLGEADLAALRQAYWDKVHAAGIPAAATCFVDMDPLKGTRLPLISRLFPEARVLLMRRDPRDVVWSCFRTNFAMTSGTLEYVTLERAARHYDAMMRLTELAMARLPLSVMEVRYDQLVREFDAITRQICEFVGLEWSEAVRRFDRTAEQRGVSTASAGQVRQGLYDGTRQWEPYAAFLEPVMPLLQPWIDKFGYA